MEIVKELENGLILGKIESSLMRLKEILSISEEELFNDSLLMIARYNKLQSEIRQGIIETHEEEIRYNRIVKSALSLLKEIKKDESIIEKYHKTKSGIKKSNKAKDLANENVQEESLLRRISLFKEYHKNKVTSLLRITKNPVRFDRYEGAIIKSMGIEIIYATTSKEAEKKIKEKHFDVIISSSSREVNPKEGFDFHIKLIEDAIDIPFIFYVGYADRSKGVPPFAFGITHRPNELIHLLIDALERC